MIYTFSGHTLNERTFELRRGDQRIALERRVFDVVAYLVRNHSRVVSKAELFRTVWEGRTVTDASLSIVISAARKALGDDAIRQEILATHHGRGYRCIADVTECEGHDAIARPDGDRFVGRASELEEMTAAVARAREGRLQVVLLAGEAGIGKTRLVEHFSTSLRRSGNVAIVARSPEEPGAPPFWPWIQILRDYLEGIAPSDISLFLSSLGDIAHLLPEVRHRLPSPPPIRDPLQARFRLFDAIATFLDRAAKRTHLTIYLDDIHRADEASLLLLSYITTAIPESPLLVVATYRDTHRGEELSKLASSLLRSPVCRQLRLGGLQSDDATHLMNGLVGRDLDPSLLNVLYEKSGGNPFFLCQLARHVGEFSHMGRIPSLPADLADAIAEQIGDLSSDAKDLLTLAAVIGSDLSISLLSAAAGVETENLLPALQEAVDARVVTRSAEDGCYRFAHALLRDALYQRLSDLHRSRLHQRVARALVDSSSGVELEPRLSAIAHHFYESTAVGSTPEAIAYARQAGEAAATRLAYEEAALQYARALELLDRTSSGDEILRCDLLRQLGAQLTKAGDRESAKVVFDRLARLASKIGASTILAEAALGLAPGVFALEFGVTDSFQIELSQSALRSLGTSSPALRSKLLARLSLALHWSEDGDSVRDIVDECTSLASQVSDAEVTAYSLQATWFATRGHKTVQDRFEVAQSLVALRTECLEPEFRLVSQLFLLTSLLETGEMIRFDKELAQFKGLADALRQPQATWYTLMLDGMKDLLSGDFASAGTKIARYTNLGSKVNDANSHHSAIAHTLIVRYAGGQLEELLPAARLVSQKYPSLLGWRAAIPWLLANLGRMDEAARELSQLCVDIRCIRERLDWPAVAVLFSETVAMLGDRARAEALYEVILPREDNYAIIGLAVVNWGSFSRHLGLLAGCLGRWRDSIRHFEKALQMNEMIGAHPWVAHTEVDLAQTLLRCGDRAEKARAGRLLKSAQQTAERLGMPALAGRASEMAGAVRRNR